MGININILDSNNIVTLVAPGKTPLKTSGGMFHWTSNQLLCASIASCVGKSIVRWCLDKKVLVNIFQHLEVDMVFNKILIIVQHDKNLDIDNLENVITHCDISKMISLPIEVKFIHNDKEYKPVKVSSGSCCGG